MKPLTRRQSETLAFIREYVTTNAVAPTLQDIADHFALSKVTVLEQVGQLEAKGHIHREKYKSRGITLVDDPRDTWIADAFELLIKIEPDLIVTEHRAMALTLMKRRPAREAVLT